MLLPNLRRHPLWLLAASSGLLAAAAWGQPQAPVLTFANGNAGGASDSYFAIDLADGSLRLTDRLTRDPLSLRTRRVRDNLFAVVGRPAGQAAAVGEILLAPITASDGSVRAALYVETPIGYAAWFENPGRGGRLGEIRTFTGRPFEELAAPDGNFVLLPRRDSTGRADGAYLYHATTGRALYLGGLRKPESSPPVTATPALPALAGRVAAAELHAGSESTAAYLVADPASGEIHFFSGAPAQIAARKSAIGLYDVFSREGRHTSARRFVLVPVNESPSRTLHVFFADAVAGETAVLVNVTASDAGDQQLRPGPSLGRWLESEGGERVFSAVPRVTSTGQTIGLWLVDSQTRATLYVDRPGEPDEMTVSPVTIARR